VVIEFYVWIFLAGIVSTCTGAEFAISVQNLSKRDDILEDHQQKKYIRRSWCAYIGIIAGIIFITLSTIFAIIYA
jgi:hypothetical protein